VRIGGGPATIRDFLAADLIDVCHLVQVPLLLGRGVRLWDGLEGLEARYAIEAVSSPSGVTHLTLTRREQAAPRTPSSPPEGAARRPLSA
ncbi:MAG: dihydrofolate reductase family protein, partial [Chloroflexota bacterium]|nr:dihydrofolate reductase family protein [Chloroflexota bacterium]